MSAPLSAETRLAVAKRAGGCCEFCLIHQEDVPTLHEIDHLIARKHGGQSVSENLALTCLPCNRHKGSGLTAIDPETQAIVPLFNPRAQLWPDHFALRGAHLIGLTPTGRATAKLLQLNLPVRANNRRLLMEKKRYPPTGLSFLALIQTR